MATFEEILEAARKLPVEEQRRLRAALDALDTNGGTRLGHRTKEVERAWIDAHRDEYLGQWVALDGDNLIAHGTDPRGVYEEARAQGITAPYLVHVTPKAKAYVEGW
jgi:hypothetical protein